MFGWLFHSKNKKKAGRVLLRKNGVIIQTRYFDNQLLKIKHLNIANACVKANMTNDAYQVEIKYDRY